MAEFEVRQAQRRNLKARIGLSGSSGAGKTMSALKLARGLVGPEGRLLVIDTEQASSEMYEDTTPFQVLPLEAPYSPERYEMAIAWAEKWFADQGTPEDKRVLIIDQISNAWAGAGGVLEFVDKQKTSSGQAKGFNAWKDATPKQQRFVERLLMVKAHLIVTMRSKVEWVIDKDDRGKSAPRKIGMAPVQREGIEYEFQIMLDLDGGGEATVSKDRTGQLFGKVFKVEEQTGADLAKFMALGKALAPREVAKVEAPKPPTPGSRQEMQADMVRRPEPPKVADPEPTEEPAFDGEDPVKLVGQAEAKLLVQAAKNSGMKREEFAAILKSAVGVEQATKVPAALFMKALAAVTPAEKPAVA